jgi:hypothetical protein
MARLYIPDSAAQNAPPSKDGYANFALNAILNSTNFKAFVLAQDDERPNLIKQHAGKDVTHLVIGQQGDVAESINNSNCLVDLKEDLQKKVSKSKHHISLPKKWTSGTEVPDIAYLDKYVTAICEIARDDNDPVKARNFLFGVMLLTRCR